MSECWGSIEDKGCQWETSLSTTTAHDYAQVTFLGNRWYSYQALMRQPDWLDMKTRLSRFEKKTLCMLNQCLYTKYFPWTRFTMLLATFVIKIWCFNAHFKQTSGHNLYHIICELYNRHWIPATSAHRLGRTLCSLVGTWNDIGSWGKPGQRRELQGEREGEREREKWKFIEHKRKFINHSAAVHRVESGASGARTANHYQSQMINSPACISQHIPNNQVHSPHTFQRLGGHHVTSRLTQ